MAPGYPQQGRDQESMCPLRHWSLYPHPAPIPVFSVLLFHLHGSIQELKKAILDDMVMLGKESGLHSFEQVTMTFLTSVITLCIEAPWP